MPPDFNLRDYLDARFLAIDDRFQRLEDGQETHRKEHREDGRQLVVGGSAGGVIGGVVVAILAYFGVRPQ